MWAKICFYLYQLHNNAKKSRQLNVIYLDYSKIKMLICVNFLREL